MPKVDVFSFDVGRSMFDLGRSVFPPLERPHPLRSEAYISLQSAVYLVESNLLSFGQPGLYR